MLSGILEKFVAQSVHTGNKIKQILRYYTLKSDSIKQATITLNYFYLSKEIAGIMIDDLIKGASSSIRPISSLLGAILPGLSTWIISVDSGFLSAHLH